MTFEPERDERIVTYNDEMFQSNQYDYIECDAGWWRETEIDNTRARVKAWRIRNPICAIAFMLKAHRIRSSCSDPLLYRATQEYIAIATMFPELSVRETWRMAWHNARSCLKPYQP